MNPWSGTF
jgi:hypothetical protein